MNRALVKRIPLIRKCIVRSPSTEMTGILCNMSVAGAYVGMEPIPNVGDELDLERLIQAFRGDSDLMEVALRLGLSPAVPPLQLSGFPEGS